MKVEIPVARVWSYQLPPIIRYIEATYVNAFFRDGSLMLSTLARCKEHEDCVRRDVEEGRSTFHISHGDYGVSGISNLGTKSYLLCGSISETTKLMKRFQVDNYIKINNVLAFADEVSRWIPGFCAGKLGPCFYKSRKIIERQSKVPMMPDATRLLQAADSGNKEELEQEFENSKRELGTKISVELEDAPYFIKQSVFEEDQEFRFVWRVPYAVTGPLEIKCPGAIKYCEPGILTDELKTLIKKREQTEAEGSMFGISGYKDPQ